MTVRSAPAALLAEAGAPPRPLAAGWRDYVALLKPKVVRLVVFTGACGLFAAPGHVHPVLALTAILCIAVAAGAAGAMNMVFEADIDALMKRTRARPIPAGRVDPKSALEFAGVLAFGSVFVMGLATNALAAGLLALSIAFYVGVYTLWLKRRTPQNIVIGGAAGAFPPLIGWAAATGNIDALPVLLFAIVFLWTPPHFWALALFVRPDYAAAGVPMMPVVAGERRTRDLIWWYSLALAAAAVAPWAMGLTGAVYGVPAAALSVAFLVLALRVWRNNAVVSAEMKPEKRLFLYSIAYLFALFAAVAADGVIR
jgi:protoheme IX farnesyltransferase